MMLKGNFLTTIALVVRLRKTQNPFMLMLHSYSTLNILSEQKNPICCWMWLVLPSMLIKFWYLVPLFGMLYAVDQIVRLTFVGFIGIWLLLCLVLVSCCFVTINCSFKLFSSVNPLVAGLKISFLDSISVSYLVAF